MILSILSEVFSDKGHDKNVIQLKKSCSYFWFCKLKYKISQHDILTFQSTSWMKQKLSETAVTVILAYQAHYFGASEYCDLTNIAFLFLEMRILTNMFLMIVLTP